MSQAPRKKQRPTKEEIQRKHWTRYNRLPCLVPCRIGKILNQQWMKTLISLLCKCILQSHAATMDKDDAYRTSLSIIAEAIDTSDSDTHVELHIKYGNYLTSSYRHVTLSIISLPYIVTTLFKYTHLFKLNRIIIYESINETTSTC